MKKLLEHNELVRKNLLTLIGMGLCMYFSYHLIQGERSYIRYLGLKTSITHLEGEVDGLKNKRETLETRVAMLRPGSIDKDLLEERARFVLGYRFSGEKDIISQP
ncbi:MAG: septum formation initiator family protein [Pseudobdellovibrionaceae bacterium]